MTGRDKDSDDREVEDQDSEPTTMAPRGGSPTDVGDDDADEDRGEHV